MIWQDIMVFISYNLSDFNRLIKLSNLYSHIEIRQDLCQFTFDELDYLFQQIKYPIFTVKGTFANIREQLLFALNQKVKYLDFDYNWDYSNLIDLKQDDRFKSTKFIASNHFKYQDFNKHDINKYIQFLANIQVDYIKIVIEDVDNYEDYDKIKDVLNYNSGNIAIFCTGNFGKFSRVHAYINGCPLNYAAIGNQVRINASQLDIGEYFSLSVD